MYKLYFDDKVLLSLLSLVIVLALPLGASAQSKDIVGWVERVRIYPGGVSLKAKLDTGAKVTSINAPGKSIFIRDGEPWVRFHVHNSKGDSVELEKRVIRMMEVKRKGVPAQERPVVRLGLCLGNVYKEVEVNLVDRSNYHYQLLVGRNFLKGSFVIDPSLTFTTKSECPGAG